MKTKEQIANLAFQISHIPNHLLISLNGKTAPNRVESYCVGILRRQAILLSDIEAILRNKPDDRITSAFILLRSLLEDFILMLHLLHHNFDEEEIIKLTADAHRQRFRAIAESKDMNEKYFDSNLDQLYDTEKEQQEKNEFTSDPDNDIYFADKEGFRFKRFPTMQQLVSSLPETEIGKSNIHAFLIWKFLSNYVHYSGLTDHLEKDAESRQIEVNQLEEILFYCWRTSIIASAYLKRIHPEMQIKDPFNVEGYFGNMTVE